MSGEIRWSQARSSPNFARRARLDHINDDYIDDNIDNIDDYIDDNINDNIDDNSDVRQYWLDFTRVSLELQCRTAHRF